MIPDSHVSASGWGVYPVAFSVGGHDVPSYSLFVALGLAAAIALYFWNTRKLPASGQGLYIAAAAVVGGIVGSKVPVWVLNFREIVERPELFWSGRTIVGGIIGGALAVYATKRALGIRQRMGNYLVPSLCLGILLGRIGCFLAGCCCGTASALPWALDFGDGIARHPTQLYEALFILGLLVYSQITLERHEPGALFSAFMVAYFAWRFAVEFVRVNPVSAVGLTYYQLVAVAVMFHYAYRMLKRTSAHPERSPA